MKKTESKKPGTKKPETKKPETKSRNKKAILGVHLPQDTGRTIIPF